jgi:mono/diheme cytochrome c family protein
MRTAWTFVILAAGLTVQSAQAAPLTDQEKLGRQLFTQHCGICHTKPTLTSPLYGPALSKETLGGDPQAVTTFIKQGTDRMPGFRFMLNDQQVSAVAAFLKTMNPPTAEQTKEAAPQGSVPDRQD